MYLDGDGGLHRFRHLQTFRRTNVSTEMDDYIHADVDGRLICTGDHSVQLIMTRPDFVGQN